MRLTANDSPYQSFNAAVPANLVGKEGYGVEQVSGTNTIQLYTAGPLIGWLYQRLEGDTAWNVRLAGKGGTVRVVAGGAIGAAPAMVKMLTGGTMVAAATTEKAHGVKIRDVAASASGDFIEIIDRFEVVP